MKRLLVKAEGGTPDGKGLYMFLEADFVKRQQTASWASAEVVTEIQHNGETGYSESGHFFRRYIGENGKTYQVFTDWSAREEVAP